MNTLRIPIIPGKVQVMQTQKEGELDLKAICLFAATGFFLERDTYFTNQKALQPATEYQLDAAGRIRDARPYWSWFYEPRKITLQQATGEFADLFEKLIKDGVDINTTILPLSGGLDSRTLAAGLVRTQKNVNSYTYSFTNGHDEARYGHRIATACGFPFHKWLVRPGYLWNSIDHLAALNRCQAEFTHPRQMAFITEFANLGDLFMLGHWGDVLFDGMNVPENLPLEQQLEVVIKKIIKKGGLELGKSLWNIWGIEGDFHSYLRERVLELLKAIDIPDSANARIRAFKSLYWAPRWTSANLSVFESVRPIFLPYYHNDMCRFICTIPEVLLSGRKIQIEYLKLKFPPLAKIPWQQHAPFNLYTYRLNTAPVNWPFRAFNKLNQVLGMKKIQRNWELQFLGDDNFKSLRHQLSQKSFTEWIPGQVVHNFLDKFQSGNTVYYAHSVSMLLTLAMFHKNTSKFKNAEYQKAD